MYWCHSVLHNKCCSISLIEINQPTLIYPDMCPLSLSSKYYNTNLIILALEIAMLVESDTLSKPILTDF